MKYVRYQIGVLVRYLLKNHRLVTCEDDMPKDQLERPEDLISAREAGKMAGKKLATIRSWVRKGKITGYRKDPSKKNSTLMISDEELRTYLALNAEPNHPNVKGRPETLSVSLIEKDKRIEELEKLLVLEQARNEALVTNISDLRTFNDRLQTTVDSQSYELKSLRSSFESLLDLQVIFFFFLLSTKHFRF